MAKKLIYYKFLNIEDCILINGVLLMATKDGVMRVYPCGTYRFTKNTMHE